MLSCISCSASFGSDSELKCHYKSEYHTFNLQRCMKSLQPISEKDYLTKKEEFEKLKNSCVQVKSSFYCRNCKKKFSGQKSYEDHLKSKKHKKMPEREVRESSSESELSDAKEILEENVKLNYFSDGDCLFCDYSNLNLDHLFKHMNFEHGFSIPFQEHLKDPVGLLKEMYRLVEAENSCLSCGKQFFGANIEVKSLKSLKQQLKSRIDAVCQHMIDRQHNYLWCGEDDPVMLALKCAENPEVESLGKVGGELFHEFYDGSVYIPKIISPNDDELAYEVILPTGARIGHREYNYIYRQKIPISGALVQSSNHAINRNLLPKYSNISNTIILHGKDNDALVLKNFKVQELKRISKEQTAKLRDVVNKSDSLAVGMSNNIVFRGRHRRQY